MSTFDVRHLRAFAAVAEEQHFTRAAERLHMAQPPLSQLIRSLEHSLQTQLFVRTTRSVTLTVAGRVLLDRSRHILNALEDAVEDVHRVERGELGRMRLGFTDLCAVDLLPRLAQQFQHRNPTVHLDLLGSYTSYEEVDLLLADDLDAGIIHGNIAHPALSSKPLRTDQLVVALPDDHRLAAAETVDLATLADDPFVTYPEGRGSAIRENVLASCAAANFRPRIVGAAQESMAIVALVAAGVGVAVLPSSFTDFQPPGCTYLPLAGNGYELALTLVWRSEDDSATLRRFVDVASELVKTYNQPGGSAVKRVHRSRCSGDQ